MFNFLLWSIYKGIQGASELIRIAKSFQSEGTLASVIEEPLDRQ
jgi:hypothetical protein